MGRIHHPLGTAPARDSEQACTPRHAVPNGLDLQRRLKIYAELSKARLSALVVVTAGAGYAAGTPMAAFDPLTFAALCAGTSLAAGSANTWNQVIERHRDKTMKRTCERPLPSGRVSAAEAVGWGAASGTASVSLLLAGTNPVVAGLGAANIALYALPYTLSKPKTELNTWVGALVGAVPPVMGWCAAGGDPFAAEPACLAATLFLWQFPHFFSLAWIHKKDYARGGHQMVPVNDPTGERTAALVRNYSLALLPVPILASACDVTSAMYALEGLAAGGYAVSLARAFEKDRTNENARKVFKCSLWYLPLMLALFVFHRKGGDADGSGGSDDATAEGTRSGGGGGPVDLLKAQARKACLHDAIVAPNGGKAGGKLLCPKVEAVERVK